MGAEAQQRRVRAELKDMQRALIAQGTTKRVYLASMCLTQITGEVATWMASAPWTPVTIVSQVCERLREMGCDLTDVEIRFSRNAASVQLQAAATAEAQARARRAAEETPCPSS